MLMTAAPLVVIMLWERRSRHENKKLNYILMGAFAGLFILSFALIRT